MYVKRVFAKNAVDVAERVDIYYWQQIEHYISVYTDARFSHGICPDCKKELYPGFGRNN